jgi:predicted nicotinamide N-methyase
MHSRSITCTQRDTIAMKIISFSATLLCLMTLGVSRSYTVLGVPVHRVPLQRNDANSPYCFAASSTAGLIENGLQINFLATQVWPSARLAAVAVKRHLDPSWVVCELGCGPGLPSLTAAKLGATRVIATDLDAFSLKLVEKAAAAQKLVNIETRKFDLTEIDEQLPPADLYLLSDVFESATVAIGAAHLTMKALSSGASVWVFAQTDRAQRETYLEELRKIGDDTNASWTSMDEFEADKALWLCDVEEGAVIYG